MRLAINDQSSFNLLYLCHLWFGSLHENITLDISAIESERPGCKCVDSFFVDVSPSRLPRRHRLPDAGFIPDVYNLEDVCEIALDILNSNTAIGHKHHFFSLHSGSRARNMNFNNVVCLIHMHWKGYLKNANIRTL